MNTFAIIKQLRIEMLIDCNVFLQKIIKEAGKADLEEIKVHSNIEETSVREFKVVVQKLQASLKREKQLHTLKSINEKNKSVSFKYFIEYIKIQLYLNFRDTLEVLVCWANYNRNLLLIIRLIIPIKTYLKVGKSRIN